MPTALELVAEEARACTRCALAGTRTNVVFGTGNPHADLVFVGEAPGQHEDEQGLPFVGRSGQLLSKLVLEEMGIVRETEAYTCNTLKCRPPGNRDPLPEETAACSPFLARQLELIRPRVIVTLGNPATRYVLQTKEGITKLRGRSHPHPSGAVVVPTYHPAAVLRGGAGPMAQMRADLVRAKLLLDGVSTPA
jgi:uracil-DNA glycosylase family 4